MFELSDIEIKIIQYALARVKALHNQELRNILQQGGAFPEYQKELKDLISNIDLILGKFSKKNI